MVEEAILNVRNVMTITNTLVSPDDGNFGIALPHVFCIFHFMLQSQQSIDEMFLSTADLLITVIYITFVCGLTYCAFEYFCNRASSFDPGALIGIGVAGCIGVICFFWLRWDATTGIILSLLGGCIGSGIFKINNNSNSGDKMKAIQ